MNIKIPAAPHTFWEVSQVSLHQILYGFVVASSQSILIEIPNLQVLRVGLLGCAQELDVSLPTKI
jgi:hypothetical protein